LYQKLDSFQSNITRTFAQQSTDHILQSPEDFTKWEQTASSFANSNNSTADIIAHYNTNTTTQDNYNKEEDEDDHDLGDLEEDNDIYSTTNDEPSHPHIR